MLKLRTAVVVFTVAVPLTLLWAQDAGPRQPSASTTASDVKRPGFAVCKETTYVTEPLTEDGYPNYFAAWEREASRGVTPDNNAVAVLMRAFGPGIVAESQRAEFFGKLGVPAPPVDGRYFVSMEQFAARLREVDVRSGNESLESGDSATPQKPIDDEDEDDSEVLLETWLAEIDSALDIAVEASKRTHWYEPMLSDEEEPSMLSLAGTSFAYHDIPGYLPCDLTVALVVRAACRAEDRKQADALQDLMAAHRLARLMSQNPSDRGWLSAYAINAGACALDAAIASSGEVPSEPMERHLQELVRLGPLSVVARQFEWKRYRILEAMTRIRSRGALVLASVAGPAVLQDPAWQAKLAAACESERPMRIANSMIDLLISAACEPTYSRRVPRAELAGFAMMGVAAELVIVTEDVSAKGETPSAKACEQPAMILMGVQLQDPYIDEECTKPSQIFFPPFVREAKAAANFELAIASWALALYRAEHGHYPETIEACTPRYLPELRHDPFRDAPLVYRRDGDHYILYSVGPNEQDDDGKNSGGMRDLPRTDDISVDLH